MSEVVVKGEAIESDEESDIEFESGQVKANLPVVSAHQTL